MARARSGGSGSGSAWALVIFGAGFFISLLLGIIFFTQVSGARQAEEQAKKSLGRFATPSEQSSPEVAALIEAGGSVIGALLEERAWLRTTIAQDASKSKQEIKTGLLTLGLEDRALFQEIKRLQNDQAALRELKGTLEQELGKARQRADQSEQATADLDQSYKDSLTSLNATLSQTTDALQATRDQIHKQKLTLDQQMAQGRGELQDQLASMDQQMREKDSEITRLLRVIDDLTGGGDRDPGPGNLTRPDGRIVSLIGGRNEVYISLGLEDRLLMGMTFEVFGVNELIKLNEFDRLRGKATLEVVSVDEAASVARVVRQERGTSIKEGDSIANLVYDPRAIYKFHVYGDFDIEGVGRATAGDRERILSMINRWGGEVSDDLTYDVDYLVLGDEPPLPTAQREGAVVDPRQIAEYVQAQQAFETYQQLVGEARSLDIPVLNQNRFLALVGYYNR